MLLGTFLERVFPVHCPVGHKCASSGIWALRTSVAMRPVDQLQRHEILFAYQRCKNISQVARHFSISRETARKWVRCYEETGGVLPARRSGRRPSMDKHVAHLAMEMLLSGDYSGSNDVAKELHAKGLTFKEAPLSRTTVVRHAKAIGKSLGKPIVALQGAPKKALSARAKRLRFAFCMANLKRCWKNVMFTDRKKFLFTYPGAHVNKVSWVRKGQKRVAFKADHAMGLNVYAGLTTFGMTKPHLVAGTSKMATTFVNKKGDQAKNITSAEYEMVVMKTLLPQGKCIMGSQGITSWVLQQDNDPTHKKASAQALGEWKKANHVQNVSILLNWPPNSPDLSPIENVWAYVQGKVNINGCKTFDEFKQNVLHLMQHLPKGMTMNLFRSMKSCLQECIRRGGDKTHY